MSVSALKAVFDTSLSKGAQRLVLLALADEASDAGYVTAYRRSQSHLARKANVDASTVWRSVEKLVELGELQRLRSGNGRESSDYRIVVEGLQPADPQRESRVCDLQTQGLQPADAGSAPRGPHHPVSNSLTPVESTSALALVTSETPAVDVFDQFWRIYPRRAGKGAARKAWQLALRKVDGAVILEAATRYAADPNQPDDKTKIPHPATWLNQERWEDDPLPAPLNGRGPSRLERTLQNAAAFIEGGD